MTLPKQVEEAGKLADEALKAVNQPPGTEPPPVDEPGADTNEDLQATIDDLKDQLDKSEHKFKVLQGKFKAEIEPIRDDVNTLKNLKNEIKHLKKANADFQRKVADLVTQNAQFVTQNKELQTQLANKTTDTQAKGDDLDVAGLLSEEDRKTLESEGIEGPAIDVITKLIAKSAPKNKPEPTPSSEPTPTVADDTQKQLAQDFWFGLDDTVKDWRIVNRMPEFIEWLSELAPYHGDKTRHNILDEATEKFDLKTVVDMFNDFMASDRYKTEQVTSDPPENNPSNDSPAEDPLESQVEPNRSQDADIVITPTVTTPEDPSRMLDPEYVFRTSEITAFYRDATQSNGLFRTNPELYSKIDQAIMKAGNEDGRIVNG